jgi:hypothetical protein
MNAVTESEVSALTCREIAVEEAINDVEQFAGWLESVSDERLPCAYFGPISSPDLVRQIVLNASANAEQHHAACLELRKRYLDDFAPAINARAQELGN